MKRNVQRRLAAKLGAITFSGPAKLSAANGGPPRIEILAYTGGPLMVAGFSLPVVVDLAGLSVPSQVRPILIDHDDTADGVLGQTDAIVSDPATGRLVASGVVLGVSDQAQRVAAMATAGYQWQASIGALVEEREMVAAGQRVVVNGRSFEGPVIVARKATLREISFVPTGADDATSARIAAALAAEGTAMTFEEWVASLGIDAAKLDEANKAALMVAYEKVTAAPAAAPAQAAATTAPAVPAAPAPQAAAANAVADLRAKLAEESDRVGKIMTLCASHAEIGTQAIKEGWSIDKTELAVLRASRPKAPHGFVPSTPDNGPQVLEAALAQSCRANNLDKRFDARTLQAAHDRFKGRLGLQQLMLEAAWAGGYTGRHFDTSAVGMKQILQAGFSSLSLPGILSNNVNKFLLDGFMGVEDSWKQIAATANVQDFKTVTSYRMTGDMNFEEVGPAGELKHGTLGEESFTNQAKTYGKMFAITRHDIINDDLGALSSVPAKIGRGAALKLNLVFWTAFMDNSSFFASGNSNYMSGSTTNLSVDSLTAIELLFLNQTDPDGNPLGLNPRILLVPNALNTLASTLMRATEVRDTTASTKYTTNNPHAGKFDVVRSSYLSNTTITGYSTTAFYLLAAPNDMATIEVCFLNGQQTPIVEDADADFSTLGIQMRGYFDFGVAKQEHRAGAKSKGAA